jgi:peptide/nickel transport system ATP-binding protein
LLASIARGKAGARAKRLNEIPGMVPSLREPMPGCAFAPRCQFAIDACRQQQPGLQPVAGEPQHQAACLRLGEVLAP